MRSTLYIFVVLFVSVFFQKAEAASLNASAELMQSGICSWYNAPEGFVGACGRPYRKFGMTTAHLRLPCGTRIRVRNKSNGKSVVVVVEERGPHVPGRILDLSYGAFGVVESRNRGLFPCDYQVI